jgi:hypothetical protein
MKFLAAVANADGKAPTTFTQGASSGQISRGLWRCCRCDVPSRQNVIFVKSPTDRFD